MELRWKAGRGDNGSIEGVAKGRMDKGLDMAKQRDIVDG